jgi:hypothetical protein
VARSVQIREDTGAFTSAPDRPGGSLGTGLFSAYVDESDHPGLEAGPASVPVDDAIAWGRANASTVVVLVCDDAGGGASFSAGEVPPAPDAMGALLQWPDEGGLLAARRLACHATSGLPAPDIEPPDGVWEVELDVFGSTPIDLANFVSRWVKAVSGHDSVTGILGPVLASEEGRADEPGPEFWTRLVLPEPFVSAASPWKPRLAARPNRLRSISASAPRYSPWMRRMLTEPRTVLPSTCQVADDLT